MVRRALVVVLGVALLVPATGEAAFPGANGKIAFSRAGDIWTMNSDGTDQVNLTNTPEAEGAASWSADGNRIAFGRRVGPQDQLFVMFADGTGVMPVPTSWDGFSPAWSPDGNRLTYASYNYGAVLKVNLDGTGEAVLWGGETPGGPAWSPDGSTIAFDDESGFPYPPGCQYDIWTTDTDENTGDAFLVTCPGNGAMNLSPNWSPDGTRIAYQSDSPCVACGPHYITTIDPDGTDRTTLPVEGEAPAWSPDGSKIAYGSFLGNRIRTVNPDGTGITDIAEGFHPDWQPLNSPGPEADVLSSISDSPDPVATGGLLTYTAQAKNLVGPDDASGVTLTVNLPASVFFISATPSQGSCSQAAGVVTCNFGNVPEGSSATATIQVEPQIPTTINASANVSATELDPVPGNNASSVQTTVGYSGYPRTKGATPIRAALVPAYRTCDPDQATLTHGPPLTHPSCASPALTSGHLTVGTPDANGRPANSSGYVTLTPLGEGPPIDPNNGDQADVAYELSMTDVRKASDLTDYTGELQVQATLRLTDRENTFSMNAPATVMDMSIAFTAPCSATVSTTTGATCGVSTTADALLPNSVDESKRETWELGKLRVLDGGTDGDAETGPNTLFAVQGIFVP